MRKWDRITVLLRDEERILALEDADSWQLHLLLAPLSASPRTFTDYTLSACRYLSESDMNDMQWEHYRGFLPLEHWCVIDLVQQRVVFSDEQWIPENAIAYEREESDVQIGTPIVWIHFPPWWKILVGDDWRTNIGVQHPVEPSLDFRSVLFGAPFCEFIASQLFERKGGTWPPLPPPHEAEERSDSEEQAASNAAWLDINRQIHTSWLMTPREDLRNTSPRFWLHQYREWKSLEMEFRSRYWAILKKPPYPVLDDCFMATHGPVGLEELVIYFEFCRAMIHRGLLLIAEKPKITLKTLVKRLTTFKNNWMKKGVIEGEPLSPAAILDSERRLMPRTQEGTHIECGCPLCSGNIQSSLDLQFVSLEGYHLALEDEFAFSLVEDQQDFESQQREYESFSNQLDHELEGLGLEGHEFDDEYASVWRETHVNEAALEGQSPEMWVLSMAFRIAEITSDLQSEGVLSDEIDQFLQQFEKLRDAVGESKNVRTEVRALGEALEAMGQQHSQLVGKSADLQSTLDQFLRRFYSERT